MPGLVPPLTDAPPSTAERQLLLAYLAQQRDGVRYAAYGLTDEQARRTPTAGALSIGGLLKHLIEMERSWIARVQQRPEASPEERTAAYENGFAMGPDETLAGLLETYADVAKETEAAISVIDDLSRPVPVPEGVPWFPADVDAWSVRWVLLHLLEEVARHAGHADIVRESIDGATMYPLMAAAEGWPATDWLQPWTPSGADQGPIGGTR